MIFRKLLTNVELMLIATIALCTAIDPEIETTIDAENGTTINIENHTAIDPEIKTTINIENSTAINTENDTTINTENDTIINIENHTTINPEMETTDHLPDLIPLITLHYDAKIRISYITNDIIGECNITIVVNHRTKKISMHPMIFTILQIVLYDHSSAEQINIPRYSFNNKLNMLTIEFTTPKLSQYLSPGKYSLMMVYTRHIDNNKNFISTFYPTYSNNTLKVTGVDILTPRELFPCWNETHNVTFKISIKHHKEYTALSNMPIQTIENDDARKMIWTHFAKSPLMFIQHIKVVITTFTKISTSLAYVTLWGREKTINYLHLAQCISEQVLRFLDTENYNVDKLKKIDYVAFWDTKHNNSLSQGLIIYSETNILHDEDSYPIGHKFEVSYFITKQIVSLWYDDVVLWSKTGFVTFLAAYIFHQIPSDDDVLNLFITEIQRKSFVFNIASNANKTNSLSYSPEHIKSSNIWRMLCHMITADVFWTGIRKYNTINQINQTNDLWNVMRTVLSTYQDNSSVLILKELTSVWMAEKYYPALYVTRNHFINKTAFEYLSFIDEDTEQFPTYVTYTTRSIMNFHDIFASKSFWLTSQRPKRLLENFDANDWIIVNLKQTGYYRVNYDTENWLNLAQYMNSTRYKDIHILNRAQIIDDAFYFYTHKQLDYAVFWKISAFLSRETNYVVWYPMFKAFEYMTFMISIENTKHIQENMKKILSGVLEKIGYDAKLYESDLTECLREEAVKWACIIGEKHCREQAKMRMILDLYSNDTLVTPSNEWKKWMYCNGLRSANNTIWYDTWNKLNEIRDDKFNKNLEYLTCNEDPEIITEYLKQILKDKYFLKHNNTRVYIFFLIVAKHAKNDIIRDFILQNFYKNTLTFSSNTQADKIAILIVIIAHQDAPDQLNKVSEFMKTNMEEKRLINAVEKKIKERKNEYARKVNNYGGGVSRFK